MVEGAGEEGRRRGLVVEHVGGYHEVVRIGMATLLHDDGSLRTCVQLAMVQEGKTRLDIRFRVRDPTVGASTKNSEVKCNETSRRGLPITKSKMCPASV